MKKSFTVKNYLFLMVIYLVVVISTTLYTALSYKGSNDIIYTQILSIFFGSLFILVSCLDNPANYRTFRKLRRSEKIFLSIRYTLKWIIILVSMIPFFTQLFKYDAISYCFNVLGAILLCQINLIYQSLRYKIKVQGK
jgi:hypothetical protein